MSRSSITNVTVYAAAEFTARLEVNVDSRSVDIESSITNSFTALAGDTNSTDISTARVMEISEELFKEIKTHNGKY